LLSVECIDRHTKRETAVLLSYYRLSSPTWLLFSIQ
jgi:hypothetical protein